MPDRSYDIVMLGATGFTGRLTALRLADRIGASRRWAIAGRNRSKLEQLRTELAERGADVAIEQVDVHDLVGLLDLARRTKVLATTVGPFAQHGELVVQACVRAGTHYADITGEPQFVNLLLRRYDDDARRQGVKIVNCCGFDSVPHDLGAQFTVEQLPTDRPITVRAYVTAKGKFSGGTFASAIEAMGEMRGQKTPPRRGDRDREVHGIKPKVERVEEINGWAVPLPTIDPQIVLRSAKMLAEYGPDFRYGHYARMGSLGTVAGAAAGIGLVGALAQFRPGRSLLRRLAPDQGEGPDEATRERSSFRVTFIGEAGDARVRTQVSGGDPGYTETSKMLAESALCLAEDELGDRAGVLTPAAAMGRHLRERLQAQGITFERVDGA